MPSAPLPACVSSPSLLRSLRSAVTCSCCCEPRRSAPPATTTTSARPPAPTWRRSRTRQSARGEGRGESSQPMSRQGVRFRVRFSSSLPLACPPARSRRASEKRKCVCPINSHNFALIMADAVAYLQSCIDALGVAPCVLLRGRLAGEYSRELPYFPVKNETLKLAVGWLQDSLYGAHRQPPGHHPGGRFALRLLFHSSMLHLDQSRAHNACRCESLWTHRTAFPPLQSCTCRPGSWCFQESSFSWCVRAAEDSAPMRGRWWSQSSGALKMRRPFSTPSRITDPLPEARTEAETDSRTCVRPHRRGHPRSWCGRLSC